MVLITIVVAIGGYSIGYWIAKIKDGKKEEYEEYEIEYEEDEIECEEIKCEPNYNEKTGLIEKQYSSPAGNKIKNSEPPLFDIEFIPNFHNVVGDDRFYPRHKGKYLRSSSDIKGFKSGWYIFVRRDDIGKCEYGLTEEEAKISIECAKSQLGLNSKYILVKD
jgi:hypothetical protein